MWDTFCSHSTYIQITFVACQGQAYFHTTNGHLRNWDPSKKLGRWAFICPRILKGPNQKYPKSFMWLFVTFTYISCMYITYRQNRGVVLFKIVLLIRFFQKVYFWFQDNASPQEFSVVQYRPRHSRPTTRATSARPYSFVSIFSIN